MQSRSEFKILFWLMFRIQSYVNCLLKKTSTTSKTLIERHGSNYVTSFTFIS